jgi:hypothetical protein
MKLVSCKQVDPFEDEFCCDIFIAASGYEQRASFLAKKNINAKIKAVLNFEYNKEHLNRQKNDIFFSDNGFFPLSVKGSDDTILLDFLKEKILDISSGKDINILIDYSSMTRVLYGGIVKLLANVDSFASDINVYFSYSVGKFCPPP